RPDRRPDGQRPDPLADCATGRTRGQPRPTTATEAAPYPAAGHAPAQDVPPHTATLCHPGRGADSAAQQLPGGKELLADALPAAGAHARESAAGPGAGAGYRAARAAHRETLQPPRRGSTAGAARRQSGPGGTPW